MSSPIDAPAAGRLQFSLRTGLLAIGVVCFGLALFVAYRQSRENRLLREENERLRVETGQLQIEEGTEDKLQAIGIPTKEDLTWKWRVHVPNRSNIRLTMKSGSEIPQREIPNEIGGSTLNPGEHLITVAFRRNRKDQWEWSLWSESALSGYGTAGLVSDSAAKPLLNPHSGRTESVSNKSITMAELGKPLLLLRYRVFTSEPSPQQERDPANGVMVWVHEGLPTQ